MHSTFNIGSILLEQDVSSSGTVLSVNANDKTRTTNMLTQPSMLMRL